MTPGTAPGADKPVSAVTEGATLKGPLGRQDLYAVYRLRSTHRR
jgi:hypothetical protein